MQKSKVEKKKRKHWSYEIKVIGDKKTKTCKQQRRKTKTKQSAVFQKEFLVYTAQSAAEMPNVETVWVEKKWLKQ